ncbi:MAG: molybdenum cofactor guanylyltransferase [Acidobacteriota bacterium]
MLAPTEPVGVVLAGGASRRMGRDKASLRLGPTSLAERAAGALSEVLATVVVADRGHHRVAGCESVRDGDGAGPAAGILGAAAAYPVRDLLVLACDLPAVPIALLRHLADFSSDRPRDEAGHCAALVPRWRRGIEPLCALYRRSALEALAEEVRAGRFALRSLLLERLSEVRFLEGPELAAFGDPQRLFANLNTPDDLALLERA